MCFNETYRHYSLPCPPASTSFARYVAFADHWRGRFCSRWSLHLSCLGLMRRLLDCQTINSADFSPCWTPLLGWFSQPESTRPSVRCFATYTGCGCRSGFWRAHVPLSALDVSAISCWRISQSGGHRLATAAEVNVNVDARRTVDTVDVPSHHWRPYISGRGFARIEQPAVQRHLVNFIDSFPAAPQNKTFPSTFWPGLCLTIFLFVLCFAS